MRTASIERSTKETRIRLELALDRPEPVDIKVPGGFFRHMLELFAFHGGFSLACDVTGDTDVDMHHTVEDTAICLGQAFKIALGDKKGIARYGLFSVPMDEARAVVHLDISGRPFVRMDGKELVGTCGSFDAELVAEFLRAFAFNAGITLHVSVDCGENLHHMIEAIFKALARALRIAIDQDGRGILPSTKGVID
ncbi:MAG TPA: imidazoleglycerol-phosphate dehydratase HisB [Spirochaetota bacterium]|nr:imidazoleglycerol-phosphate dehydratase HisB [Spirochaetota bacterium]